MPILKTFGKSSKSFVYTGNFCIQGYRVKTRQMVKAEEIDFIAERNSEIKYLQVATTILEERTRKREIGNLE